MTDIYRELRKKGSYLSKIENQTEEICMYAVKHNWDALQYVQNQTPSIISEALKMSPYALEFVQNQTEEMCLNQIKREIDRLTYVPD